LDWSQIKFPAKFCATRSHFNAKLNSLAF